MPRLRPIGLAPADVDCLRRHLLDQLSTEVLVRVGELDLLGDGDAVVGDRGRAELLVEDDVATARAEGDLDRVGERVDAVLQQVPGVVREAENLRHLWSPSRTAALDRKCRARAVSAVC